MNFTLAELRIRRMSLADVERVLAISAALPTAPHWPRETYLAALDPSGMQRIALVAEAQNARIIGFAVACLLPPEAEVETIAVAQEAQRRGIARRLLLQLADELRLSQVTELLLEARASNHSALAFYRSVGFESNSLRPRYYADPTEDAVLMRWAFASKISA